MMLATDGWAGSADGSAAGVAGTEFGETTVDGAAGAAIEPAGATGVGLVAGAACAHAAADKPNAIAAPRISGRTGDRCQMSVVIVLQAFTLLADAFHG
jgi:hypothetical protein